MAYKQSSPQAVTEGGTGVQTATPYAVQCGGTTANNPFQSIASAGTSGQLLTSNGAAALPTFQDAPAGGVTGPGSSTDNALARWNGTGGTAIQNSSVTVTDNGEMNNTSQPAFLAYLNGVDVNATGDGTTFTLGSGNALTEIFDQNSDFVTTGTFTAPVAGRYFFTTTIALVGGGAMTENIISIVTSNRTYQINILLAAAAVSTSRGAKNTAFADMDASDTTTFTIRSTNTSGKVNTVFGGSLTTAYCSGYLVC